MAYFSKGETKQKLMLLFFLREIDYEITSNELFRVFAEQGWMEYFDFQLALTELEEDAYVAALPCAYGQGYRITPHGENTLSLFEEELPHSLRDSLRQYAKRNRDLIRDQSQFAAGTTMMPGGGYAAILRLMDKNTHILDITLQLPDARFAQAACAAWPEQAEQIYQELLARLFRDAGGAE